MTQIIYRFKCNHCSYLKDHDKREDVPDTCPACGQGVGQAGYKRPNEIRSNLIRGNFDRRTETAS